MAGKKVLFLDVNGVVVTDRSEVVGPWHPDAVVLAELKRIVDQGIELVIISDLRHGKKEEAQGFLRKILGDLMDHLHEDWATPDFKSQAKRGEEVADWLKRHPEVESYAIVDDRNKFLKDQQSHFFKSNTREGLSSRELKRLEAWAEEMKRPIREIPESAILDREKTR